LLFPRTTIEKTSYEEKIALNNFESYLIGSTDTRQTNFSGKTLNDSSGHLGYSFPKFMVSSKSNTEINEGKKLLLGIPNKNSEDADQINKKQISLSISNKKSAELESQSENSEDADQIKKSQILQSISNNEYQSENSEDADQIKKNQILQSISNNESQSENSEDADQIKKNQILQSISNNKSIEVQSQSQNSEIVDQTNKTQSSQFIYNKSTIELYNLNYGLIINLQNVYTAKYPAFEYKSVPKITFNENCYAKILIPKDENELFLLKKHIDVESFQKKLPSELVTIMMPPTNFSSDDSSIYDIYLEIVYQKIELTFEKKLMQPTEEIKKAVIDALNEQWPYRSLIKLFNTYGYIIPRKLILGEKLYKMSRILSQKKIKPDDYKLENDDLSNYSSKLNQLLNLWENEYDINISYFMTMDYDAINKETITKWINACSNHDIEALKIINQSDPFPLYEIFEESVSEKVKLILQRGNEKQVLMTGIVQIHKNNNYYRISFSDKVDRSNYQIFAKIIRIDGTNKSKIDVIDEATIKIMSTTKSGFIAIIENLDK
ncbi:11528_t:CDS:1, partial [Racocetra fulgida]